MEIITAFLQVGKLRQRFYKDTLQDPHNNQWELITMHEDKGMGKPLQDMVQGDLQRSVLVRGRDSLLLWPHVMLCGKVLLYRLHVLARLEASNLWEPWAERTWIVSMLGQCFNLASALFFSCCHFFPLLSWGMGAASCCVGPVWVWAKPPSIPPLLDCYQTFATKALPSSVGWIQ